MALIKCIECGKDISNDAIRCVHCGKPTDVINKKIKSFTSGIFKIILTLIFIMIAAFIIILFIFSH